MPPLYDYVDLEALESLVSARLNGTTDDVTVAFTYDGVRVRVDSSGLVECQSAGADRE